MGFRAVFLRPVTARIRNGRVPTGNGVSGRLGESATRARDRLLAGGDPSSEGIAGEEANEVHRRSKMPPGPEGQTNWRRSIERDRGTGDAANPACLASQADREEIRFEREEKGSGTPTDQRRALPPCGEDGRGESGMGLCETARSLG